DGLEVRIRVSWRYVQAAEAWRRWRLDKKQAIRIFQGNRCEQYRREQGPRGGGSTDAARHRYDGHDGRSYVLAKSPKCIARVGDKRFDPAERKRGAHALLRLLHAAELDARRPPRF